MRLWTRRAVLLSAGGAGLKAASQKGRVFPADWNRYSDPATEFNVDRLTNPGYASSLPVYARVVSSRNNFLVFCSDRAGSPAVFRMDLKSGESRLIAEGETPVLWLTPDDRGIYYLEGPALLYLALSSLRTKEVYRVPAGFRFGTGFSLSVDGRYAVFPEVNESGGSRLRLIQLARGAVITLAEAQGIISHPMARPKRDSALYRREDGSCWLVHFDGQQNRKLRLAEGNPGSALWAADGRTVLYLNSPADPKQLISIRENTPDTGADTLVAATSQFAAFAPNGDASVFVGASGSKASPYILLLLRVTRREMTICEHKATAPQTVAPFFSPDSQRIFFQSDRDGKPAIYMMRVDKLVEKTEYQ